MFSEFATYITRSKDNAPANQDDTFCDFEDYMMKPSELWTLCDDSDYGSIKHPLLSAVHRNPTGASGGEWNHKSAKHVHSRLHARLGSAKVESGTAIHFNAKQLLRQMQTTRDTWIYKWLQQLGATTPFLAVAEDADLAPNVRIDDDDDDDGMDIDDEFNHLILTGGPDTIADEDLFVLAEEEEERNVFDGSANALLT